MELPVTPKPIPAPLPNLPNNHSGKLFGIVYIILTGVIDTIILAAGLWSWVGKSASYLLKLAPSCGGHCSQKTWPKLPLKMTGQPPKTGSLTNKYNYLPAYLVPMTLPLTLWSNHPQEFVAANESIPLRYLE
ncbi:hypothetical protein DSO57_1027281 [Entomophthora muscae]|uniref:Uncharacterized protein n=1 Tax=Entomophthora muscae TaxID=34485 RepID=A0ACC2UB93_9FUNG|nr:hypothetical protein DSO57_1027281 [Entomophthora muscae]